MTKEEFVQQYIVQFMAAWAATNYTDFCMMGKHEQLTSRGMLEEAEFMAEEVWEEYCKLKT